jgi:hypothetical protein
MNKYRQVHLKKIPLQPSCTTCAQHLLDIQVISALNLQEMDLNANCISRWHELFWFSIDI